MRWCGLVGVLYEHTFTTVLYSTIYMHVLNIEACSKLARICTPRCHAPSVLSCLVLSCLVLSCLVALSDVLSFCDGESRVEYTRYDNYIFLFFFFFWRVVFTLHVLSMYSTCTLCTRMECGALMGGMSWVVQGKHVQIGLLSTCYRGVHISVLYIL